MVPRTLELAGSQVQLTQAAQRVCVGTPVPELPEGLQALLVVAFRVGEAALLTLGVGERTQGVGNPALITELAQLRQGVRSPR